jgi:hypothetical protein
MPDNNVSHVLSTRLPSSPQQPQASAGLQKNLRDIQDIKGEGLLERPEIYHKNHSLHTNNMAESNTAANGQTSQVKIHLTSRDENIQLPQDTGAILVATGKSFLKKKKGYTICIRWWKTWLFLPVSHSIQVVS